MFIRTLLWPLTETQLKPTQAKKAKLKTQSSLHLQARLDPESQRDSLSTPFGSLLFFALDLILR